MKPVLNLGLSLCALCALCGESFAADWVHWRGPLQTGFAPTTGLPDTFAVSSFTKIETTRALIDATNGVLRRTAARGFTPAELAKVKDYMAGQFAIRMQTPNGALGETRAFTLGTNVCRLSHNCSQLSAGCTRVEYVR